MKIQFFQDVAFQLKGFLQVFETNNHMLPFPEHALANVLHTLMKMIVTSDVFWSGQFQFEIIQTWSFKLWRSFPLWINEASHSCKVHIPIHWSTRWKESFLQNVKQMTVVLVQKVHKHYPLKYQVARCASSFSPRNMVSDLISRNVSTTLTD